MSSLANGDEGHHVGGAEARMGAPVPVEVDQAGGGGDAAERGLLGRRRLADEGEDAAVVRLVALAVEQRDTGHARDGGDDLVDHHCPATLREVGDTLDEGHGLSPILSS